MWRCIVERLKDSIIKGYPIPLILLAEYTDADGKTKYEILDGLQRLNAIVGFIENAFSWGDKYFDITQLARAKQAEDEKEFVGYHGDALLDKEICANEISTHKVVGIDREAKILGVSVEDYCRKIIGFIKSSKLSPALVSSVLSNIDIIDYHSMSVIRIKIPPQSEISYLDDDVYERQYNDTIKVESHKTVMAIAKRF